MAKFLPPNTTTAIRMANTPLKGELLFDTDLDTLFIGDGITVGGIEVGSGGGGSGDMLKSIYDTNDDGVVDLATAIAGSPSPEQYYGTNDVGTKGFFPLPSGTGGSGLSFAYNNTNFTPTANTLNAVDTITSSITATLPLNPDNGTIAAFYDYQANFATNSLTISAPTGNNILGGGQLILNSNNATVQLIFYNGRWSVFGTEVFIDKVSSGESTSGDSMVISYIVAGAIGS